MKLRGRLKGKLGGLKRVKLTARQCWRLWLVFSVLLCIGMGALLWSSSNRDTRDALYEGRRLLVTLSTNEIEGKQISLDAQPVSPASASAPAAVDASQGNTATKTDESTAASPDEPSAAPVAAEPSVPILPPDLGEASAVKPAEVPLAEIKPSLLEKSAAGSLPIISADKEKPWVYYAKPFQRKDSKPLIAIIVSGLGQSKSATNGAIKLPENVTLSFNPYAKDVGAWANAARTAGHETMLDLPLEPSNFPVSDPGPYGLLVSKGVHENASRLQWLMSRFQGYIGCTTPSNEVFTADNDSFTMLLQALEKRGLILSIGHDPAKSDTKQMIETTTTANIMVDIWLDEELSSSAIQARFAALEKKATKNGSALGMAQAFPITIQQLGLWTQQLEKDGFTLVPVSFLVSLKSK